MKITSESRHCTAMTDDALWETTKTLAQGERRELARFLIRLAEIKRRDLHIVRAYPGQWAVLEPIWEKKDGKPPARAGALQ